MKGKALVGLILITSLRAMPILTAPSPSHIQHCSPTTDHPLSSPIPTPPLSRSLTRAFRFSTHNGISQNPAKPSDNWSAGALNTRTFSMGSNIRSSTKGKEREALDTLDSGSFGEYSFPSPRLSTTARLPIGSYLLRIPGCDDLS